MTLTDAPALFPANWFREMPAAFAEPLRALALRRSLKAGEYLYRMGGAAEGFYEIISGRMRLGATRGGRDYTIAYANAGD
ncbi:MAG TPA: cyclic nucleotide-binding domain-containing protein, partial [Solimonas sp.]|nr:cyclic nucleotide-binding domain-containing protein [Solimonas sp.]